MEPNAPAPWLIFVLTFVGAGLLVGFIVLIGGLSRVAKGLPFWPEEEGTARPVRGAVRSATFRRQHRRVNGVQLRSPRANAEKGERSDVQRFSERSDVQHLSPPSGDLPATLDELQRLTHTIAIYAKRPNKELAILEAWGHTKGEGEGYQRASRLFDVAMSDAARQALKAKAQVVETA